MTRLYHTPWGAPDYQKEWAPGIILVGTPSHGGFYVSDEQLAKMPEDCRNTPTFTEERNWFEEDCDWAIVCLAFPELFPPKHYSAAVATCAGVDYLKHLATPERRARAAA